MEEYQAGAKGKRCLCPYCDCAMEMPMPFCKACGAKLRFCSECGKPLPKEADVCTHCGARTG